MAKKKDKPLYDENGRWVEERGRIKGAIRRAFRLAPQMKEVLNEARVELPPANKKDGTPGKRPRVRFRCAHCGELFPMKSGRTSMVQVDHIKTVVPLWKAEAKMTYDEIARGVFCDKSNLQVLCSVPMKKNDGKPSCHKKKTDEENWIRRQWAARAEEEGLEGYDWDMSKDGHWVHVQETEHVWLIKYREEKKLKDERKRKRKNPKRKRDRKTDKAN